CDACGAALAREAPGREERKVVTVLFADLVGFTSRAEQLDPEDVRALLSPYYGRLRLELERFGGTVEKFIGDAVMALFGAPVAHEDDPDRAVRAAIAIRDWVAEDEAELQLRIAVNTGEALIALGARPSQGDGMASGDVVKNTAGLQSDAPGNGTLGGETGIGKSRLVAELLAHVDALEEIVFWRHGRSLPYGEGAAFWALGEMVKAQAGILENDAPEDVERKLRETVAQHVEESERS